MLKTFSRQRTLQISGAVATAVLVLDGGPVFIVAQASRETDRVHVVAACTRAPPNHGNVSLAINGLVGAVDGLAEERIGESGHLCNNLLHRSLVRPCSGRCPHVLQIPGREAPRLAAEPSRSRRCAPWRQQREAISARRTYTRSVMGLAPCTECPLPAPRGSVYEEV
jgi:hypothetical protein